MSELPDEFSARPPGLPDRVVIAHLSVSLDGRVSGPGGEADLAWAAPYADASYDVLAELAETATVVVAGRRTYERAEAHWGAVLKDDDADPRVRAFATWIERIRKVVRTASRTEADLGWTNSRLGNPDPVAELARLRPQPVGGDILVLGSAHLVDELLRAGEVERLHLTVCPVVLGGGARLFADGVPGTEWALRSSTVGASGGVTLVYDRVRG